MDVRRICENPTAEDREYMPNLIGQNWLETIKEISASYKDSSFIANFLSPKVVRDLKLFCIHDNPKNIAYSVDQTHDKDGFVELRRKLSAQYEWDHFSPSLDVISFDPTTPEVKLRYKDFLGRDLAANKATRATFENFEELMGCEAMIVYK